MADAAAVSLRQRAREARQGARGGAGRSGAGAQRRGARTRGAGRQARLAHLAGDQHAHRARVGHRAVHGRARRFTPCGSSGWRARGAGGWPTITWFAMTSRATARRDAPGGDPGGGSQKPARDGVRHDQWQGRPMRTPGRANEACAQMRAAWGPGSGRTRADAPGARLQRHLQQLQPGALRRIASDLPRPLAEDHPLPAPARPGVAVPLQREHLRRPRGGPGQDSSRRRWPSWRRGGWGRRASR